MRPESWNTREFVLRAANDADLYQRALQIIANRRQKGRDPYSAGAGAWARDVAESYTPKLRVTQVAVRAALEACDG